MLIVLPFSFLHASLLLSHFLFKRDEPFTSPYLRFFSTKLDGALGDAVRSNHTVDEPPVSSWNKRIAPIIAPQPSWQSRRPRWEEAAAETSKASYSCCYNKEWLWCNQSHPGSIKYFIYLIILISVPSQFLSSVLHLDIQGSRRLNHLLPLSYCIHPSHPHKT